MSTKRKSIFLKTAVFFVLFLCLMVSSFGLKSAQAADARKLNVTKKSVEVSKTFTLKVENLQSGDTVKYKTSDKNIVAISSKGVCRGVVPGEATVAAIITGKDKKEVKLTCKVTVKEMRVPTISDVTLVQDGDFIIGSSSITFSFKADKTTTATISVCDSFNEAVYEKTINVTKNKTAKLTWKGLDNNGENVEDDLYYFRVDCDNATAKTDYFNVTDTSDFKKGNGSSKNPYRIYNVDDLRMMAAHNNCHFILANDIDAEYEPVQSLFSADAPFNGTLDGNGKTIKNLMNTTVMIQAIGENAVIKDLKIDNACVNLNESHALFVETNYGLIENCKISNSAITGYNTAMFVCYNYGIIKNCTAGGNISFSFDRSYSFYSGGIAMYNYQTGKVMNCTSSVDFSTNNSNWYGGELACDGGIVGNNSGLVASCKYSGEITSDGGAAAICSYNQGTVMTCSYIGSQEGLNLCFSGSGVVK